MNLEQKVQELEKRIAAIEGRLDSGEVTVATQKVTGCLRRKSTKPRITPIE